MRAVANAAALFLNNKKSINMACVAIPTIVQNCNNIVAGVKDVYVRAFDAASPVTFEDEAGLLALGFVKVVTIKGRASATQTPAESAKAFNQTVNFSIVDNSDMSAFVNALISNALVQAVTRDYYGFFDVFGESRGLKYTGGDITTGAAMGDAKAINVVLTGVEPTMARRV